MIPSSAVALRLLKSLHYRTLLVAHRAQHRSPTLPSNRTASRSSRLPHDHPLLRPAQSDPEPPRRPSYFRGAEAYVVRSIAFTVITNRLDYLGTLPTALDTREVFITFSCDRYRRCMPIPDGKSAHPISPSTGAVLLSSPAPAPSTPALRLYAGACSGTVLPVSYAAYERQRACGARAYAPASFT